MFHPDDKIGPYTFVRILGRGAFGEVWLAERTSSLLTTQVALKLPLDAATDLNVIRQEAQVWLRASGHTNIVPVLDAEVYDDQVVIASEYIAGGSIADWLTKHGGKAPSTGAAVKMIGGILEGLQHLHESGLIHRDLKPGNVMVQKGRPRLTDFGLTRVLKPSSHSSSVVGTPAYMAPEAFNGHYSVASDVWAAGMLLHELLTATLPYPHTDFYSLLLAITAEEPVRLSEQIPDALRQVLTKALAKSAGERFASAAEMAEALEAVVSPRAATSAGNLPNAGNNLPVQMTSFIGREKEMAEVKALLVKTRLLTLTGSGGTGKTRLLLQVASDLLHDYSDGVWLVELASVSDPALVGLKVASQLSIREEPGRTHAETLQDALKTKRLLLVLDNCEHLLAACAEFTGLLLGSCSEVKILATSRERLGIAGELTYRVPSLSMPDSMNFPPGDTALQYSAVRLFTERAQLYLPEFAITATNATAVAQVCHRLDGIPLAIELAAARVRALPVDQIAARLDDRFRLLTGGSRTALPRQQTLRALMDWSYDLLNQQEKALLHRLSVFAGGWTLEAAEAVCAGEGIEDWEILDLLTSLVDKSLAMYETREGSERYRLLETVRQYARDGLRTIGEEIVVANQHLSFFLGMAEQIAPKLHGPEQARWLERLEKEHDNLRAALEWSQTQGQERDKGMRLANALLWFWQLHSHFGEGRRWLEGILNRTPLEPTKMRADALSGAGQLAFYQNDYSSAYALLQRSATMWRTVGDDAGLARTLVYQSAAAWRLGDRAGALSFGEESVRLGRMVGDSWILAMALWISGYVLHMQEDDVAARLTFGESAMLFRKVGDPWGLFGPLTYLAEIWQNQGEYAAARTLVEEAIANVRQIGDKWRVAAGLDTLGEIALSEGAYGRARPLFEESLAMCREAHNNRRIAYELRNLGHAHRLTGTVDTARHHYHESLELYCGLSDKAGIANLLDSLGRLAATEEQAPRAARLFGQAEALRQAISATVPAHERSDHASNVAGCRANLGEEAFTIAFEEGRDMTMEQAIEYALSEADVATP